MPRAPVATPAPVPREDQEDRGAQVPRRRSAFKDVVKNPRSLPKAAVAGACRRWHGDQGRCRCPEGPPPRRPLPRRRPPRPRSRGTPKKAVATKAAPAREGGPRQEGRSGEEGAPAKRPPRPPRRLHRGGQEDHDDRQEGHPAAKKTTATAAKKAAPGQEGHCEDGGSGQEGRGQAHRQEGLNRRSLALFDGEGGRHPRVSASLAVSLPCVYLADHQLLTRDNLSGRDPSPRWRYGAVLTSTRLGHPRP